MPRATTEQLIDTSPEHTLPCGVCTDECVVHIDTRFQGDLVELHVDSKVRFRTALREAFLVLWHRRISACTYVEQSDLRRLLT